MTDTARETRFFTWKTAATPDGEVLYAEAWKGGRCHYEAVWNENYREWHVRHCSQVYGVWRAHIEQVYSAAEYHHEHRKWPDL